MKKTAILCSILALSIITGCAGPGGPGGGMGGGGMGGPGGGMDGGMGGPGGGMDGGMGGGMGGPGGGMGGPGSGGRQARAPMPAVVLQDGELSEYQVLGISPFIKISEADIQNEIREPHKFALHEGSGILLAQSGREMPDKDLMMALAQDFTVTTMSGVPDGAAPVKKPDRWDDESDDANAQDRPNMGGMNGPGGMGGGRSHLQTVNNYRIDKALRLAASKAGADTILVVWTRTSQKHLPGLRAAVIDAGTGKWEIISPFTLEENNPDETAEEGRKTGPEDQPLPELSPEQIKDSYQALAEILKKKANP